MGRRLDESLGSVEYDNLIAGLYPPAEVFCVRLAAGQGSLKRGTLLALKEGGILEMLGTDTTGKANAVLAEPAETGAPAAKTQADEGQTATTTVPETVPGIAYRTGHFNTNRLLVAEDYEITEADREALRGAGILLSDAVEI